MSKKLEQKKEELNKLGQQYQQTQQTLNQLGQEILKCQGAVDMLELLEVEKKSKDKTE